MSNVVQLTGRINERKKNIIMCQYIERTTHLRAVCLKVYTTKPKNLIRNT
jgi:hypothetical protein